MSDLYEMEFQTDMTAEEYRREGVVDTNIALPADVANEHQKINRADCLAFIYPVWWSDCPAKLKGWFDRVYTVGFAYAYTPGSPLKMKTVPKGVVVCTAGHPNEFLKEIGIAESMRNVMIDDRLGKRFASTQLYILGGMTQPNIHREPNLTKAYEIGRDL